MIHAERKLRQAVIDACLHMNASGLNQGTSGNVSVRHKDGLLITPSGVPYDQLDVEDIVFMKLDGTVPRARLKPSSEWHFHRALLAGRPDVHAVVHAHPTYATALSINWMEIPPVHYMIGVSGGSNVRVAKYATFGSAELSEYVLEAMEGRTCCLMANHGLVATGPDLGRALWVAEEVETLAHQYCVALQVGTPTRLTEAQIGEVLEKFSTYGRRPKKG